MFEIENFPQKRCGKPTPIYTTNYISLYMARFSEGFDMETGRNLGREKNGATKILQRLRPLEKSDFGQLYEHNLKLERTQFQQAGNPHMYSNMEYEMHLGTMVDCLFFQSSRILQATEIQLLQYQCEQERTQILTNLKLAPKNPRLAAYMLTAKRSMFSETDARLAWLNHCPMAHTSLHTMNQCYDRIPILTNVEFDLLIQSHDRLILMPLYRNVLTESRTSFNSICIKRILGIRLRLVEYTKINPLYLDLKKSHR